MTSRQTAISLTALVIDDDQLVCQLLSSALRSVGYEVHEANDGLEGFLLAQSLRPDLVVLDGRLPRLDGLDVIRQLRNDRQCAKCKIIFTASRALASDIRTAMSEGADAYLPQPLDPDELLTLARRLNSPQHSATIDHEGHGF